MATMGARSSGSCILSVKLLLLSTAVLSPAVALWFSAPSIWGFVLFEVPRIYGFLLSWLTPPYLYFVINGIIISIAASSRLQKAAEGGEGAGSVVYPAPGKDPEEIRQEYVHVAPEAYEIVEVKPEAAEGTAEFGDSSVYGSAEVTRREEEEKVEEEEFAISRSSWMPWRIESKEIPAEYSSLTEEKPLVSGRFGSRKSMKVSPEGRALGVARSKRNETLESTWKTITDGRSMPLTRHLKKSDTFDVHVRAQPEPSPVRKSETFNERHKESGSPSPGSGVRLRKEPSLSQDELNRRVEAFIKKFNEDMRLQRQESLQQYVEMVNRGSH